MWLKINIEEFFNTSNFDSEDEDSDDITDDVDLKRFYSLKVLPSQEEALSLEALLKMSDENRPSVIDLKIQTKVSISDFELVKALSHGAYGKVCLARKK